MQGLGRYAHDSPESPPSSGAPLMENSMYQRVPTSEYYDALSNEEPRCFSTRGGLFNLIVGIVVCANAALMAVEADLGLLGPAGPAWTGLEADLHGVHVEDVEKAIEHEISYGISKDHVLKDDLQDRLNKTLHKNIAFNHELALPGTSKLRFAAYTVCEYFFVLFFLCEMLLRLCDLGCRRYMCRYAWMPLDMAVVTTGLMDLSLPFFLDQEVERMSVLPFLRLLRVLRLLKLFQVCQPLRIVGRGVLKAFTVVLLVGLVVLVLNFGLAIILTTIIGQRSTLDSELVAWFGSIGRSMQTLFSIQTLAGWDHIAAALATVYPSSLVVPLIVLYMMVCCFAVVGLITSVISDSFVASQRREAKAWELQNDLKRGHASAELSRLFAVHGRSVPGCINRKELEAALQEPFVAQTLNAMELPASKTEILKLFDHYNRESSFAQRVQAEHMAEAVTSIGAGWRVSSFFDVKHQVLGVKNDVLLRAELAASEAAQQRQALQELEKKTKSLAMEVQKEVAGIRGELSNVKSQISKVLMKMEEQSTSLEQERKERAATTVEMQEKLNLLPAQMAAVSAIGGKIDVIEGQVASVGSLNGKVDALTMQVTTQLTVGAKVEALLGQVSAQLISLNSEKKVDEKIFEDVGELKASEPAAEPESSAGAFPSAAAAKDEIPEAAHSGEPWAAGLAPTETWAAFQSPNGDERPDEDA